MKNPIQPAGEAMPSADRKTFVADAMRDLESSVHDLVNMASIMTDLVFGAFERRHLVGTDIDRALFSVADVLHRVTELKAAYLAAYDAEMPQTFAEAVADVERAYATWMASVPPGEDLPQNEDADAFDAAERRVLNFPCHTYEDVRAKVDYVVSKRTKAAHTVYCTLTDSPSTYADAFFSSLLGKEA